MKKEPNKKVAGIAFVTMMGLIIVPIVNAELPSSVLLDSSGNGFDLTEEPDGFMVSNSAFGKYGQGVSSGGSSLALYSTTGYQIQGSMSATVAFQVNTPPTDDIGIGLCLFWVGGFSGGGNEPQNILGLLSVDINLGAMVLRYRHNTATQITQFYSTLPVDETKHVATFTRDTSTNTILVKLDGVEFISETYSVDPTGGTSTGRFVCGADQSGIGKITIYETRFWDSVVSQITLDEIANLNNSNYTQEAEGSELGLYFFEHLCTDSIQNASTFAIDNVISLFAILVIIALVVLLIKKKT